MAEVSDWHPSEEYFNASDTSSMASTATYGISSMASMDGQGEYGQTPHVFDVLNALDDAEDGTDSDCSHGVFKVYHSDFARGCALTRTHEIHAVRVTCACL